MILCEYILNKPSLAEILNEGSPPSTGQMSCVKYHVSHVTCHMSYVQRRNFLYIYFPDKVVKLVGGGSVINGATPSSLFAFEIFFVN